MCALVTRGSAYVWRSSLAALISECQDYGVNYKGKGVTLKKRLITHLAGIAKKQLARDLRIQYGPLNGISINDLRPQLVELQKMLCYRDPTLTQVPIEIRLQELKTIVSKYPGMPLPYRKLMPNEGKISEVKANGHYCNSCKVVCFCTAMTTPTEAEYYYARQHQESAPPGGPGEFYREKVRHYEVLVDRYHLARSEWETSESLKTSPSWINASKLVENAKSVCAILPCDVLDIITGFVADLKFSNSYSIYQKKLKLCKEVNLIKRALSVPKWHYERTKQNMRINFYTNRMNVLGDKASDRVIKNHTERMRKFNEEILDYTVLMREFNEVKLMAEEVGVKEGIYGRFVIVM